MFKEVLRFISSLIFQMANKIVVATGWLNKFNTNFKRQYKLKYNRLFEWTMILKFNFYFMEKIVLQTKMKLYTQMYAASFLRKWCIILWLMWNFWYLLLTVTFSPMTVMPSNCTFSSSLSGIEFKMILLVLYINSKWLLHDKMEINFRW